MYNKGQALLVNLLVAQSQRASFRPALLGSLFKFPIPSLVLTLLLARREAESAAPAARLQDSRDLVFVPGYAGDAAERAKTLLEAKRLRVRATDIDGAELGENLEGYIVFRQKPSEVDAPVGSLVTLTVISIEEFQRFVNELRGMER